MPWLRRGRSSSTQKNRSCLLRGPGYPKEGLYCRQLDGLKIEVSINTRTRNDSFVKRKVTTNVRDDLLNRAPSLGHGQLRFVGHDKESSKCSDLHRYLNSIKAALSEKELLLTHPPVAPPPEPSLPSAAFLPFVGPQQGSHSRSLRGSKVGNPLLAPYFMPLFGLVAADHPPTSHHLFAGTIRISSGTESQDER